MKLEDTTFAIIDVETTGMDPAVDRVVEVACVRMRAGREIDRFTSFVDPEIPIPATASAIHHITARHLVGAPKLEAIAPRIAALCADAVVVAHYVDFDLSFLPFLADRPALCAVRLAQRVVPDAPNYKNQVLRYHLGIDDLPGDVLPHRALGDAIVTSRILALCLERYRLSYGSVDSVQLVRDIAAPRLLPSLPFGPHRGSAIPELPSEYLTSLSERPETLSIDVRFTVDHEVRRRWTRLGIAS